MKKKFIKLKFSYFIYFSNKYDLIFFYYLILILIF